MCLSSNIFNCSAIEKLLVEVAGVERGCRQCASKGRGLVDRDRVFDHNEYMVEVAGVEPGCAQRAAVSARRKDADW